MTKAQHRENSAFRSGAEAMREKIIETIDASIEGERRLVVNEINKLEVNWQKREIE